VLPRRRSRSEWTLDGVYADEVERAQNVTVSNESLCLSYWDTAPLAVDGAAALLSSAGPRDVAYMISAKSNTPLGVRRAAHARAFDG
jgi:hypothetical protein